MRPSHACTSCGADLTYLRALPDPHYSLPVIVCPDCSHAVVRRRHTALLAARRYRTQRRAWLSLLSKAVDIPLLQTLFIAVSIAFASAAQEAIARIPRPPSHHHEALFFKQPWADDLVLLAIGSVCVGAWLVAAFPHIRPWKSLLAWGALSALVLSADRLLWLVARPVGALIDAHWRFFGSSERDWSARLAAMMLGLAIAAILGAPAGLLIRRSMARFATIKRGKLRAQSRVRRSHTC